MEDVPALLRSLAQQGVRLSVEGEHLRYKAPPGQVTDELRSAISKNRAAIISLLSSDVLGPDVRRGDKPEGMVYLRCSGAFELTDVLDGGVRFQNRAHWAADIGSQLDVTRLQSVLRRLVERHPILGASVIDANNNPRFRIRDEDRMQLNIIELEATTLEAREFEARERLSQFLNEEIDLSSISMARVAVASLSRSRWVLLLVVHHFAADGTAMEIIKREFLSLFFGGPELEADSDVYQFTDHDRAVERWLDSPEAQRRLRYWKEHLDDARSISLGKVPLIAGTYASSPAELKVPFDANVWGRLLATSAKFRVTPFTILLAAQMRILKKFSGVDDVVISCINQNRAHPAYRSMVAQLVDAKYVRCTPGESSSLHGLLSAVDASIIEADGHDVYSAAAIRRDVPRLQDACLPNFNFIPWQGSASATNYPEVRQFMLRLPSGSWKVPNRMSYSLMIVDARSFAMGTLFYNPAYVQVDTAEEFANELLNCVSNI